MPRFSNVQTKYVIETLYQTKISSRVKSSPLLQIITKVFSFSVDCSRNLTFLFFHFVLLFFLKSKHIVGLKEGVTIILNGALRKFGFLKTTFILIFLTVDPCQPLNTWHSESNSSKVF